MRVRGIRKRITAIDRYPYFPPQDHVDQGVRPCQDRFPVCQVNMKSAAGDVERPHLVQPEKIEGRYGPRCAAERYQRAARPKAEQ